MKTADFNFRTEDIDPQEIGEYFVETSADRVKIDTLKTKRTVIIQGARGVGKSFLLRVTQSELDREFDSLRILPVYLTFNKAGLLKTTDPDRFKHWMLAKICNRIMRAARQKGLVSASTTVFASLVGDHSDEAVEYRLARLEEALEASWKNPEGVLDVDSGLNPESITDAIEDLCSATALRRVILLIDEAAHVFIPEQQRQFFTLIRDLRTPYLSVKAAVYPGVTYFGDSFQMSHDAELIDVNRDVLDDQYLVSMREIVAKQDRKLAEDIEKYGEAFDALAYSAGGNPRILMRTISEALPFNATNVQKAMREFYRIKIWSEHTDLGSRYSGHRELIDWGREFVTRTVLPTLDSAKGSGELDPRVFIWIHRDAPASVREALRLLCYSGILHEAGTGLVATRGNIGSRYMLNIGTRTGRDNNPIAMTTKLRRAISIKRMVEFGANHHAYASIARIDVSQIDPGQNELLDKQLSKSVDSLVLTDFCRGKLKELGFDTVGKALGASEKDFRKAKWVGHVRSRQMMNAATEAVLEYLSG